MAFSSRFAAQLAHPRGISGRLLGRAMDIANGRPLSLALAALDPQAGERVLDGGCGTGAALAAVRARADCALYGVDRSDVMIEAARRRLGPRVTLAQRTIEDLPRWAPFHGVLALNVLYFADGEGRMIAGMRRALRQDGRLIAYVTHRKTMEGWAFARAGVHRLFDKRELEQALVEGGFARSSISIKDHPVGLGIRGLVARAEC